jgi:hypothetical protein
MLRKLRPHSVYDVMAAIAFFIAVAGGSAYAAATIGASDIKNDAVLSRHIKDGEVKSSDLDPNVTTALTLHCPSGLHRAGDLCFEPQERPRSSFYNALKTCARAQRRLPGPGELALAFDHLGAPQDFQWVADFYFRPNQPPIATSMSDDSSRQIAFNANSASVANDFGVRCVVSASN